MKVKHLQNLINSWVGEGDISPDDDVFVKVEEVAGYLLWPATLLAQREGGGIVLTGIEGLTTEEWERASNAPRTFQR
jgi:hypothetical protein